MIVVSAYFRFRNRHDDAQPLSPASPVQTGQPLGASGGEAAAKPDRLIGLVLIGNNLVNILASALATIVGMRLYGDLGVAIATGILTFAVLLFAEVLPKTFAALYPERIAFPSSVLLAPLQR